MLGDSILKTTHQLVLNGKAVPDVILKYDEMIVSTRALEAQQLLLNKALEDFRSALGSDLDAITAYWKTRMAAEQEALGQQLKDLNAIEEFEGKMRKERGDFAKETQERLDAETKAVNENLDAQQAKIKAAIKDHADRQKQAAESYQRIWEQATASITADFIKGFSDVIFHAKGFMKALKDIAVNTAESMFKAFMTGLLSPLTSALSSLGRSLASRLMGGLGSGGILGKLGGLIGVGGAAAGTASAAGLGTTAGALSGLGVGGTAAGAGAGGLSMASIGAFATNPITLAVAGAIAAGFAVHHFVGQGRRAANEFVGNAETPFRNQLGAIVDSFDSMKKAGSLTLQQAQTARDSAQELWRSFLQSNAEFAAQGKTQAKVAEQSLDHLRELFGSNLRKVFEGMDTTIAGLKGSGGSGIPSTGLAQSASTRFADAVDRLIPAFDSIVAAVTGVEPRGAALVVNNEFAPAFTFYGVPESLQQQIREQIEPQLVADLQNNTRGITEKIKEVLGL
jgi:hypothetical protein